LFSNLASNSVEKAESEEDTDRSINLKIENVVKNIKNLKMRNTNYLAEVHCLISKQIN
jgi:hypothetical protein